MSDEPTKFEEDLRGLTPEGFKTVEQILSKVRTERDPTIAAREAEREEARKVAKMNSYEFEQYKRSLYG